MTRGASLLPAALVVALTVGFWWKLVLSDQYTWLEKPELAWELLPSFQFQAGEWQRGRFPLWDPHRNGGEPVIGSAHPGAAYPLNWLLFVLPLRDGWIRQAVLHWYFVLIHALAALFTYALCRDLGRSHTASVAAGALFALGGYLGALDWPPSLNAAVWAPLVFLFLLRALRGKRPVASAAVSGACLGLAWLSGDIAVPACLSLAAVGLWVYAILLQPKVIRFAVVCAMFTGAAAALDWLPALNAVSLSGVAPVPYPTVPPASLAGIVVPGLAPPLFTGVVALALACLGLFTSSRSTSVRLFTLLGGAGLLVAVAAPPLAGSIVLFHLATSVLIAFGVDSLSSQGALVVHRWVTAALGTFGALVLAGLLVFTALRNFVLPAEDRIAVTALAALLAAAMLGGNVSRRTATLSLIGLMLIELGNVTGYSLPHRLEADRNLYLKKLAEHSDVAAFLRDQPWPVRVSIERQAMPFRFGDWYGIDVFQRLPIPGVPDDSPRLRDLFAVTYAVTREQVLEGQRLVWQSAGDLRVWESSRAMPRVWTVHQVVSVTGDAGTAHYLNDPQFDFREKAFVTGQPSALDRCAGSDQVRLVRREPNYVVIDVAMACTGMVVLAERFHPGWRATIDSSPADLYAVYTLLRGVRVGSGRHRIEMRYLPWSVTAGMILTATAVVGAVVLAFARTGLTKGVGTLHT